jgi:hypothetical protein
MPVTVQMLFDRPQHEIASMLVGWLKSCRSVWIVTGFATVEGVRSISEPLIQSPQKLQAFVIGAGTSQGFEALDRLVSHGVPPDRLFVHLGHTRLTGPKAKHRFYRYHPMLHSKIYLFEFDGGKSVAVIGSNNVTGFALMGLNGEAAVAIEGQMFDPEIQRAKAHVMSCVREASQYSAGMKDGFTWWTSQFVDGLRAKVNDSPRDDESKYTIIVLAESDAGLPKRGDIIYFEIPTGLARLRTLGVEVHIFLFDQRPATADAALAAIGTSRTSLWCTVAHLGDEKLLTEAVAGWYISDRMMPVLRRAPRPFRPRPVGDVTQVLVTVFGQVQDDFEYLFGSKKAVWEPVLDEERSVQVNAEHGALLRSLALVPPEDRDWQLVKYLRPLESDGETKFSAATQAMLPAAGSYILVSARRRKRHARE